jgi:hydrogenase nickel incorporation protein HypA/HybF
MHEWALAEGVISTVLRVASEENAGEVVGIKIRVGELQQIDRSNFEFAIEELAKGTIAERARVEIEPEKSAFKCRICRHGWSLGNSKKKLGPEESESIHLIPSIAAVYIRCPKCGSPDFEIEKGRGVWVNSVRIKK